MIQVKGITYFMNLVHVVYNGKAINHNPFQIYGKFIKINNFIIFLHSKIIWVEQNNSSPLGKEMFYKEENCFHMVLKGSILNWNH
jgi:hypothetical protein